MPTQYPSSTNYSSLVAFPGTALDLSSEVQAQVTYRVKVVWDNVQSITAQFDISKFDGTAEFADPLVADFGALDGSVETISNVESINIRRGRDDNLENFSMGTCTVSIVDKTGRYNPSNTSGPLYGKLRPMRQMLVTAQVQDLPEVPLFRGYIRTIDFESQANQKKAKITANDFFSYLNRSKPVFNSAGTATTTGAVLRQILSSIGWTENNLLYLETGDSIPSPGVSNTSAESSALSLVSDLLEVERGDFYISANGTVTYKSRQSRATKSTFARFTNVSGSAIVTSDLDRVKNRATVVRDVADPGTDVTTSWSDATSVSNYGTQDFSTITSKILNNDTQSQSLAQWLVAQRKEPLVPFREITVTLNTVNLFDGYYGLFTDLTDRIEVGNTSLGQTLAPYFVESLSHEIRVGRHDITYSLIPIGQETMVLDRSSSTLNSAVLGY